jgi:hypothetical protein
MATTIKTIAQGAKGNFQLGSVLVGLISGTGGFAFDAINTNDYLKLGLALAFMAVVFIMYRDYKIKTAEIARLRGPDPAAPPPVATTTAIPNLK